MSSDYYIPLTYVVSQPGLFQLKGDINGSTDQRAEAVNDGNPDYEDIKSVFEPVLMCKFGARDTWRYVEVFDDMLHVSCAGDFRNWFIHWASGLGIPYESAE